MKKAVFLDRDGVINRLVFNPSTGEYESPHLVEDLDIYHWAVKSLRKLADKNFLLFLISNQPSYAKGKTSLANIMAIHNKLHQLFVSGGVEFAEYYYCYHHPNGIIPEYTGVCRCRKPSPYFLREAEKNYCLDVASSWLVGDQDTDIMCGQTGGVRTIQIENEHSVHKRGKSCPDYRAADLEAAVQIIFHNEKH